MPIILPQEQVDLIMDRAKSKSGSTLTVDLERCIVVDTDDDSINIPFRIHSDPDTHEFRRQALLKGLDEIDLVLAHGDAIADFEARRGPYGGVLTSTQ